jgi:hypothetical protein
MFGKKKPELSIKSRAVAVVYLQKKVTELEKSLKTVDGIDAENIQYDIDRLDETIIFLGKL